MSQQQQPQRVPPHDLYAEMAVLGSMMLGDQGAVETATEMLAEMDFYRQAHAEIFGAMIAISRRNEPVDVVTLKNELNNRATLDDIGGLDYLMKLGDIMFTTVSLPHYAQIVRRKSLRRKVITILRDYFDMAYGPEEDSPDLIEDIERSVFALRDNPGRNADRLGEMLTPLLTKSLEAFDEQQRNRGRITGLTTGFARLDFITSGWQRGDLITIAGRPSMGKSAFASQLFTTICRTGHSAIFASLEMSKAQISQRIACTESRVNALRIRTGISSSEEWLRLSEGVDRLWDARGMIDDNGAATVGSLRSLCRRHKAKYGLDALFVDYMQLMPAEQKTGRGRANAENRNIEMGEVAEGLKSLAREFNIPVFALSQLSRSVERREDKRPILSDLRDSGAIEAAADLVIFPFRADYYKRNDGDIVPDPTRPERAEIIIAKQRMGPTGSVPILFTPAYTRFDNLDLNSESDDLH